ncbi:hypothetical protein Dsin_008763, partial [Dipteronia sinensis]
VKKKRKKKMNKDKYKKLRKRLRRYCFEDEHYVIWFWLEKGKQHECPVYFPCMLLFVYWQSFSPLHWYLKQKAEPRRRFKHLLTT